jgi:hypothetical protein
MPADDRIEVSSEVRVDPDHPWLGLHPFTEETQSYFFGRTDEIREMFLLVRENPLAVLFGQSGLGKTSLLRAGLIPKLWVEQYRPVRMLLDFSESAVPLVDQVRRSVAGAVANNEATAEDWSEEWTSLSTLWEIFAQFELRPPELESHPLVLIFDQFEEVFTLGGQDAALTRADSHRHPRRDEVRELIHQLADLIENRPPIALQESFRADRARSRAYDFRPSPVRVVLALREDYLSHIEAWKPVMPSLMRNRLPLRLLSGPQALEAVIRPGRMGKHSLVSWEIGAAIVRHVAQQEQEVPLEEIEAVPPLVSLLCERLNAARLETNPPQDYISSELVAVQSADILQRFYDQSFDLFPEVIRPSVRVFVEEELLTVGGHRKPVPREDAIAALAEKSVPEPSGVLDQLLGRRLLTSEHRGGLTYIEITHDVLAPLAVRSRDTRKKLLSEEQARNKRLEAETRAANEKRQRYRDALYQKRFVRQLSDDYFWSELLDEIEVRRVRPVLGAQAVTLAPDDRLLSSHAARELPIRLGIDPELLPPNPTLKQIAAAAILRSEDEPRFHPALREIVQAPDLAPGTILRCLAKLSLFPLFFTTTPDQLLERALSAGGRSVDVSAFHPRQPEDIRMGGNLSIYHLLGMARNFPACAISSEDALDYAISFSRHLPDLRHLQQEFVGNSLLVIGLGLSDWLTQVLLRVALGPRLDDRAGGRWLAELTSLAELAEDPNESFPNSTVLFAHQRGGIYAISAEPVQFVLELEKRWTRRQATTRVSSPTLPPEPKLAQGSIFISYAQQDIQAAEQLCQQLRKSDLPVWFDRSPLQGGDDWARILYKNIESCALFVSLISRATESEVEAYYHRERAWAAERQQRFPGEVFYLPVVADDLPFHEIRREPAVTRVLQPLRAPAGRLPAKDLDRLAGTLRLRTRTSSTVS